MEEKLKYLLIRLKGRNKFNDENADMLEKVVSELSVIINRLYQDDPRRWDFIKTGIDHTQRNHSMASAVKKTMFEEYKVFYEQTEGDIEEILTELKATK